MKQNLTPNLTSGRHRDRYGTPISCISEGESDNIRAERAEGKHFPVVTTQHETDTIAAFIPLQIDDVRCLTSGGFKTNQHSTDFRKAAQTSVTASTREVFSPIGRSGFATVPQPRDIVHQT